MTGPKTMPSKHQAKSQRTSTATAQGQDAATGSPDIVMSDGENGRIPKTGVEASKIGSSNDQRDNRHGTAIGRNLSVTSIVDGSGSAMEGLQIQDHQLNGSAGERLTTDKKRKADDDGNVDGNVDRAKKHARMEDPAEPCCTACAMWYNIFPDLKCSKARGLGAPCFHCFQQGKQHECVEVDARCRPQLRRVQIAAKAYAADRNVTTEGTLNKHQSTLIKMIKSVRHAASKVKVHNESAIEAIFIRLAFEQDIYATNDLASLRDLPRLRDVLNIRGTKKLPSIANLDHTKAAHLEIVAAHLVGDVADNACEYCSKGDGFFRECIAVPDKGKLTFLNGVCTNCAIASHSDCSIASHADCSMAEEL
ncbi:MAG: hypothetical protein Q9180_007358 [Flavoplaca navasiana]